MENDRLQELLSGWEEGTVSPAEMDELAALLEQDQGARARVVEQFTLTSEMVQVLRRTGEHEVLRKLLPAAATPTDAQRVPRHPIRHSPSPRQRWLRWTVGIAASGLIALGALGIGRLLQDRSSTAIATLESVEGEVYVLDAADERQPAKPGQLLYAGQGLVTVGEQSQAVVKYPGATRIHIGADTTVSKFSGAGAIPEGQTAGPMKVYLANGSLTAQVGGDSDRQRLVVATPQGEFAAVDTQFTVWTDPALTQMDVDRGSVQSTSRNDGTSIAVRAGWSAVVDPMAESMAVQPMPARVTKPRKMLLAGTRVIRAVAFAPDGQTIATGCEDGTVKLWAPHSGTARLTIGAHSLGVTSVAFSPDGRTLASSGMDRVVRLWNVATGTEEMAPLSHRCDVRRVAFSPDGLLLATAGDASTDGKQLYLWNAASGEELAALAGDKRGGFFALAFSPDGKTLATAGRDSAVRLWDVADRKERLVLRGHRDQVFTVAFSPDGKTLASGSNDRTVKLWDVATGEELRTLRVHSGVTSVAISLDGQWLAAAFHQQVALWDLAGGQEQVIFRDGRGSEAAAVTFSPDGKTLAVGERASHMLKLWDMPAARPAP